MTNVRGRYNEGHCTDRESVAFVSNFRPLSPCVWRFLPLCRFMNSSWPFQLKWTHTGHTSVDQSSTRDVTRYVQTSVCKQFYISLVKHIFFTFIFFNPNSLVTVIRYIQTLICCWKGSDRVLAVAEDSVAASTLIANTYLTIIITKYIS